MATNPQPRPAWHSVPWVGLRAVLAVIALVLFIIHLSVNSNIHLVDYAGILLSIAVLVP